MKLPAVVPHDLAGGAPAGAEVVWVTVLVLDSPQPANAIAASNTSAAAPFRKAVTRAPYQRVQSGSEGAAERSLTRQFRGCGATFPPKSLFWSRHCTPNLRPPWGRGAGEPEWPGKATGANRRQSAA